MDETQGTAKTYVASLTKPFVVIIIGVIVILALFGVAPLLLATADNGSALMNFIYLIPVAAVLAFCIALLFMKNKITVSDEEVLIVTGGYFRKHISLEELSSVKRGPYTSLSQGIGVRVIPGRRMGYLCGGNSIVISTRDGATIVASTPDPDVVVKDIKVRKGLVRPVGFDEFDIN